MNVLFSSWKRANRPILQRLHASVVLSNNICGFNIAGMSSGVSGDADCQPGENKTAEMPEYVVGHDEKKKLFYIRTVPGSGKCGKGTGEVTKQIGVLQYRRLRDDLFDLHHTEVLDSYRGQGIGKHLAKAAMDYVVSEDARMRLTCTYLQRYLKLNPIARYYMRVESSEQLY